MKFRCIRVLLTMAATAFLSLSGFAQLRPPDSGPKELPQLVVLFAANPAEGMTAEQALAALQGGADTQGVRVRAGNPQRVRYLLADRLTSTIRATLPSNDAVEDLHHWLVFEYPSVQASKAALARILDDRQAFKHAHQAVAGGHFSVDSFNPLYEYTGNVDTSAPGVPGTSSKAAYEALNIPNAWNYVPGYAQVGAVDNGIDMDVTGVGVHPDLKANFRRHFSKNLAGTDDVTEPPRVVTGFGDLRGHGTHVSGLIAATPNNNAGSRGVCGQCSLSMLRRSAAELDANMWSKDQTAAALAVALQQGVQVYNWSGGYTSNQVTCGFSPQQPICSMLGIATTKDVLFVAAAGNTDLTFNNTTNFPANQGTVIAVGASAYGTPLVRAGFSIGEKIDYLAPGERIFSTFYYQPGTTFQWNPLNAFGNGTSCLGQPDVPGYGYCSGTSMSSPIIAGSAALIRSANPLLTVMETKAALSRHAQLSTAGIPVPNIGLSVYSSLYGYAGMSGFAVNGGSTPLFSLYHAGASGRHLYTTIPQVGAAASCGMMKIGEHGWFSEATSSGPYNGTHYLGSSEATTIAGYSQFPGACMSVAPVASVKIFTTSDRFGFVLRPLYRMSWNGMQGAQPTDSNNRTLLIGHAYVSNATEIPYFESVGYVLDGIEGYMYPPDLYPQPSGTVPLYRRYKQSIDDYGLFTDAQLSTAGAGYAPLGYRPDGQLYEDLIGYVCPNTATPTGVCIGTPLAPGLYAPQGGTLSTTPVLTWFPSRGATSYRVVFQGAGGATLLDSTLSNAQAGCEMGLGACFIQPNITIASGITYNWYVVPSNALGVGTASPTYSFVLGEKAVMTAPTPGSTLASSAVTFSFTTGTGASTRQLTVGTTPGGIDLFNSFVSGTSQAVSGLPTNGSTIYVRLWSYIGGWQSNDYTYTASSAAPAVPTTIAPDGVVGTLTPTYSWTASAGATSYWLLSRHLYGEAVNQSVTPAQAGCSSGSGTCSFTPTGALTQNVQYAWFVNAANASGTSAWSTGRNIMASAPATPVTIAPTGTATTTPTLTWNASPSTTQYFVLLRHLYGEAINQFYTAAQVGCPSGTGICSLTVTTPLTVGTNYAWFVYAMNGLGTSSWSDGKSFTAQNPTPSAITSPANGSTLAASSMTLAWDSGVGVGDRYLTVGTTPPVNYSGDIFAGYVGNASSQVISNLPVNGSTIYVRLNSWYNGMWNYRDYTYTAATAARSAITSPAPGSTISGSTATFQWTSGVAVGDRYLTVGTTPSGNYTGDIFAGYVGAALSKTLTNLPANGATIYVRLNSWYNGMWNYYEYAYTSGP